MFDWGDLRFFMAVHRAGSLAGAARELRVDATTVGRRVSALERELGARLFDHATTGLRLTRAGESLLAEAAHVEDTAHGIALAVGGDDGREDGIVRVACSETIANRFLLDALADFPRAHPNITLVFTTGNPVLNLLRREADVAIRTQRPSQAELIVRSLGQTPWRLYEKAGARAGPRGKPARYVGGDDELARSPAATWLAGNVRPEEILVRCNSILAIETAIAAGLGQGLLPQFVGDVNPRLARVAGVPPTPAVELWLVVHPELRRRARVRAVTEAIVRAFSESDRFSAAPVPRRARGAAPAK